MSEFITIYRAKNIIEAEMYKDMLVSYGIDARVIDENTASLYHHVHAISAKIQVPIAQKEKALKILCESNKNL